MNLHDDDVARVAEAVAQRMQALAAPVLTTEEAAALAKKPNARAFRTWAQSRKLHACGKDRWSRERIIRALEREASSRARRDVSLRNARQRRNASTTA